MSVDSKCVFCKIVAGEIPSYKIHENDDFLAVLDLAQFTRGHTIAIPKKHFETIWDVPKVGEYFEFIRKVGNHYRELGYKYVDTVTMGRMVPHSHVHIVPHNADDRDWEDALDIIGAYQTDKSRWLTEEEGKMITEEFSF